DAVVQWARAENRNLATAASLVRSWVLSNSTDRAQRISMMVRSLNDRYAPKPVDLVEVLGPNFPLVEFVEGMRHAGMTLNTVALALFGSGGSPEAAAQVLKDVYGASVSNLIPAMKQANLSISRKLQVIADVFGLSPQEGVAQLRNHGFTTDQIGA